MIAAARGQGGGGGGAVQADLHIDGITGDSPILPRGLSAEHIELIQLLPSSAHQPRYCKVKLPQGVLSVIKCFKVCLSLMPSPLREG